MNESHFDVIVVDAGHSRVKFGWYRFDAAERLPTRQSSGTTDNSQEFDWDDVLPKETGDQTTCVVMTGSNQQKIEQLASTWPVEFPKLTILDNNDIPVKARVDFPEKVGADRLLNAVAVNAIRPTDQSAIIVDSGTAMTIDAVNSRGEFLGGAILPGILMSARGLHEFTTTLHMIDGRKFLKMSPPSIGRNTDEAIASGLYWGHLGAAKELVARIDEELGSNSQLYVTGGAQPILQQFLPQPTGITDLSLIGIALTAKHVLQST